MFYATLDHIDVLAPAVRRFWFRPEKPLDYTAGQFIELYLPHPNADSRGQKRWFTVSSAPSEPLFSITSRFTDERPSSFKQNLLQLTTGRRLQFADPMGDFVLPKDAGTPLIFVAAGMGITPVHSMIRSLHDSGEKRDVELLYTVRRPDELLFTDLFNDYGVAITPIISQPAADWPSSLRRVNLADLLSRANNKPGSLIYLSGPEQMVEYLNTELQKNGVAGHRLVVDFFHGYQSV